MNDQELKAYIAERNDDELASKSGMVYQVWEDGEITLQKAGPLLWQRNLHMIAYGDVSKAVSPSLFPHKSGTHGYAFVTEQGAAEIRRMLFGHVDWKTIDETMKENPDLSYGEAVITNVRTNNEEQLKK